MRRIQVTPSALLILAISELINFRDTQPTCSPVQRFKCGLCVAPPSHGRGRDGSLFLLLYDSFIHSFTPVYPDAIQAEAPAPPPPLRASGSLSSGPARGDISVRT